MRNLTSIFAVALLVTGCATGSNHTRNASTASALSPSQKATILEAEGIGRQLFEKDLVAAKATDLLLKQINPKDYPDFAGWLVKRSQEGFVVSFYLKTSTAITPLADVYFTEYQVDRLELKPSRILRAQETAMLEARQTALSIGWNDCSERFNSVVLPQTDGTFHVYVLAATIDPDAVVVGGHSKIHISADGKEALDGEPFSKSCLVLDKHPDDLPEGAEVTGLFVTHVLSELPAPTHVFVSMLHRMNLMVGTSTGVWSVNNGKITLMSKG